MGPFSCCSTTTKAHSYSYAAECDWVYGVENIIGSGHNDTLMGDNGKRVLSEINTLSVGGFEDIQKQSNKPIIQHTIQTMIDYVRQNR